MDNLLELWGFALKGKGAFLKLDTTDIRKLNVPVLLFTGDRSPQWLVEISTELNRLLPNSQMVILGNSSQGLMFENPADFASAAKSFIAKH